MKISENKTDYQSCFREDGIYLFPHQNNWIYYKGAKIKFRYATDEIIVNKENISNWNKLAKGNCYIMSVTVSNSKSWTTWHTNNCPHLFIFNTSTKEPMVENG